MCGLDNLRQAKHQVGLSVFLTKIDQSHQPFGATNSALISPKWPHFHELKNARILRKITSFKSWKTAKFSGDILSLFCHYKC